MNRNGQPQYGILEVIEEGENEHLAMYIPHYVCLDLQYFPVNFLALKRLKQLSVEFHLSCDKKLLIISSALMKRQNNKVCGKVFELFACLLSLSSQSNDRNPIQDICSIRIKPALSYWLALKTIKLGRYNQR